MIGIGVNIRPFLNKVARAAADYYNLITADGGVSESPDCVNSGMSDLDRQNLLNNASLLLIPSGYKANKLYSEIPTNGNGDLTWTRGSDAFRTNASGLIQRVPWNLVRYSEEFDNASWLKLGGSSVTANTTTAPNGTLTADTLSLTTNASSSVAQSIAFATTTTITVSVYAKVASGTKDFRLRTDNPTTTQSFTATTSWQRFSMTATPTGNTSAYVINDLAGTAGDLFIWGFQVVEGTTAQTYLPTTDRLGFPRLDYTYGSCPSALLEPQRTNLLPNQLSYNTATGVAYSTSVTDSPVIGLNSTRITKNEASGTLRYGNQICSSSALAGSTTYTISAYFKYDGYAVTTTMEYNNSLQWGGTSWNQIINIASTGVTLGSSSSCTGSVQNVGNGWYRVSVTITTGASISGGTPVSYLMQVASTLSTGQGFLQAAPQFEVGAYSTTPILTSGASATRVADSFSRNNIYTNGLITSSGGTWFVELRNNVAYTRDGGSTSLAVSTTSGDVFASSTGIEILNNLGLNRLSIIKRISGTATSLYLTTTDTVKIAVKWNGTSADVFVNGTKQVSATAFTTTNMEFLKAFGADVPKFIQQMALFPTPLSDTDCELLTGTAYSSYESMATALGYYVI